MNYIHGTMVETLLYYCKFYDTLKLNKFKINPYDPCVSNQLVNESQQYILFHVDYCKLIHKDTKINDSFIAVIGEEYQSIFEDGYGTMQVKREKFHKYLGMTLDYSKFGQVKITMLDYINEILDRFDKLIQRVKVLSQVLHQILFLSSTNTVKSLIRN